MRRRLALAALAGLVGAAGPVAPAASAESPRIHYMLQCQGCHRADGSGSAGAVPSLVDSIGRFVTVPGGREFLVRVPGSAQSPLSDAELAEVLNWMIRSFGPEEVARDFEPFGPEEVASYRGEPLAEVESVRSELMRRIDALTPLEAGSSSRTPAP